MMIMALWVRTGLAHSELVALVLRLAQARMVFCGPASLIATVADCAVTSVSDAAQIVTKAAQRLSLQSYPRHPMDCYVPAHLQSIAMPLKLVQENKAAPVSANQSDILPSITEYTPRMIEVSIKDTDKQPGEW